MKLKQIIGNQAHWNLNKDLVKKIGLTETLVLQHFIDLSDSFFDNGWFYQQQDRICDDLSIKVDKLRDVISRLKRFGVISIERRGMPNKNYYKVNPEKVMEIINMTIPQQDMGKTHNKLPNGRSDGNIQSKTKENTTTSDGYFPQQEMGISVDKDNNKESKNKDSKNKIKQEYITQDIQYTQVDLKSLTFAEVESKFGVGSNESKQWMKINLSVV